MYNFSEVESRYLTLLSALSIKSRDELLALQSSDLEQALLAIEQLASYVVDSTTIMYFKDKTMWLSSEDSDITLGWARTQRILLL